MATGSMAPNDEVSGLRTALAMGAASATLVSDDALQGTDALGTAKVLAAAIGFATTVAEPALIAVSIKANQVSAGAIGTWGLRVAVAVGGARRVPSMLITTLVSLAPSANATGSRRIARWTASATGPAAPWAA